ncbi:MAG: hypothetical protein JO324_08915 [Candidatus Eremiobacteraeota bacterium]|nr:hypothetical protein [Candidatus Eremiobacteraeota bacterium]
MRPVAVVLGGALVAALCCGTGAAQAIPALARADLGSQLMLRLFGETGDARASLEAAFGSRVSESPLRAVALQVRTDSDSNGAPDFAVASAGASTALTSGDAGLADLLHDSAAPAFVGPVHLTLPSALARTPRALVPDSLLTATYQPIAPAPDISPAPGTLAFGEVTQGLAALRGIAASPSLFATPALRVGNVRFEANVNGGSSEQPQLSLSDTTYGAAANFNVRAGSRDLSVNLGTNYEHVGRTDQNGFSAATLNPASWQLPNANAPLAIANYANLSRTSVGAGLAVPLVRGVTLNLNYDTGHLFGGYGLPGLTNLDAVNDSYGGRLTFDIPGSSSKSLSISAYQDRFSGTGVPVGGSTQLREDVNFTVKF